VNISNYLAITLIREVNLTSYLAYASSTVASGIQVFESYSMLSPKHFALAWKSFEDTII